MDDDLFHKIVEDCRSFQVEAVEPFLNGEPFMDKKILERVEHIRRELPKTSIRLYTNGWLMTPEKIDAMSGLGIDHLFVSLNSLDPDEYKQVMGLRLDRTIANLDYLCDARRRKKTARNITIRMIRMPGVSLEKQDKFIEFCKRRGAKPMISDLFNYKGDIGSGLPVPGWACDHVTRLDILSDGKTALCCMDQEGEYSWGDASEKHLLDIYRGSEAVRYREMHAAGKRKQIEPCGKCNVFSITLEGAGLAQKARFLCDWSLYHAIHRPRGRKAP